MATLPVDPQQHDPRVNDYDHPAWMSAFSYQIRHQLVDQDLEAGRTVSAILMAIVTGGLILGLAGVMAALMMT